LIILSPITNSPALHLLDLDVSVIKKKYLEELSISIDKYLPADGKVYICLCPDTGYRFYYPFTISGDADFYHSLQRASKNYYEPWKWENEQAAKFIKPSDFLLDVGCGDGLFLKEMKKKGMENLFGIDFAARDGIKNEKDGINIENATIDEFSNRNIGKFDVVACFQVLEHITEVRRFMEGCLQCLKPSGLLIIAVPNSHPYIYKHDLYHTLNLPPHHAGLWDKSALEKLCNYFPLKSLFTGYQPIGSQLDYYINVQLEYYSNKGKLFNKIYRKYLYLFKNKIEGHSQIVVYRKK
jgi:2-polyprenyl-3-methyl-5-hydroxy-6-metoxy-1,4-benzoquinol methylase